MFLAELVKKAHKYNGIVTAYIYGEFGYGKTSYALWTAHEVYGSWKKALDHLYFKPHEVIEAIGEAIRTENRIPVIIMDDAGLWLDRLTWYERDKVMFMQLFNLIRSVAAGVLFTTPSQELPNQILNKCFFRIKVEIVNPEMEPTEIIEQVEKLARSYNLYPLISKAIGYRLKTLPTFFKLVKKTFYDYFPTYYPIFNEYTRKRREALGYYFKKLFEFIETPEEEREEGFQFIKKSIGGEYKFIKRELERGTPKRKIVKELMKRGIPRATAYYHIKKVEEALKIR